MIQMDNTNPDLKSLHNNLIGIVSNLNDALNAATDLDTIIAIATEISEVNHRVTLVGNLLFTQETQNITSAIQNVNDAIADVQESIQQIQSVTDTVNALSSFLALVDNAIDIAKLIPSA